MSTTNSIYFGGVYVTKKSQMKSMTLNIYIYIGVRNALIMWP